MGVHCSDSTVLNKTEQNKGVGSLLASTAVTAPRSVNKERMSGGVVAPQSLRRSAAFLFDLEFLGQHFYLHHDLAMLTNPMTVRRSQLSAQKAVTGLLGRGGWLGHGALQRRRPVYNK